MEEREETRKIQFTGKSSYIVSLPKRWVTDLGLKQGDQIRIQRHGSVGLHVYPVKHRAVPRQKEGATMEIGASEETSAVVRKMISLYLLGFKTINIRPKKGRLNPRQRTTVKNAVKSMLMGSEIISDSTGGITIQVLVNLLELSIDGAFKRMIHLAKSMLGDAILAVKEGNLDLAEEVIDTDDEVDRFGFYIIRQIKIAIQNEHMLEEMGLDSARNCLGYRVVVKNIERTGDHAAFIARDVLEFKKGIKAEILGKIQDMNDFAIEVLDEACLALFKGDYVQAERTIVRTQDISGFEGGILDACRDLRDEETLFRVRRMTENIKRIAEYASDIAEIVLNINVEKALLRKP